jgi:hypothetical protein
MELDQVQKFRLVEFFGDAGARIIIEHFDDLEQTFGGASEIILRAMNGKIPKTSEKVRIIRYPKNQVATP